MTNLKIRVDRAALAEAAAWVAQATPKKATVPVLAGMTITAHDFFITIRAFDYETSHEARVEAEVLTPGSCLVSAKTLVSIVSALKVETVELVEEDARLAITAGRSTHRVRTMRVDDYPTLPAFPTYGGRVSRDDLAAAVETIDFAADRNPSGDMSALTAIHIEGDDEYLRFAATDRFCIGRTAIDWDTEPGSGLTVDVPVSVLHPALKGLSGPLALGADGGLFGLSDDTRTFVTRVLDVDYPKTDRYFDLPTTGRCEVRSDDLAEAVKRTLLLADAHGKVFVNIAAGEIELTGDSESGDSAEYVDCDASEEIEFLFSGPKLMDALNAFEGRLVQITYSKPTNPVVIRPADESHTAVVVMPRRKM